ncbi:MAG: hypothetical protein IKQ03_11985 [Prevotella sp.]|jgi:hypothetical protein|nr:hypothetical protein [Prevotella sp.]
MKKILFLFVAAMMVTASAEAQNQPAGIRMEVAEAETDHGEYSIFTYKDNEETFGYYLGVSGVTHVLGLIRDDITDASFDSIREACLCLGSTSDEAFSMIDTILDLFDKDVNTTVEFKGRTATGSERLGEPNTVVCVVQKKPLGGKRLQFLFTKGQRQAHAYLTKTVLKELRAEFKIDKKLHPKQHR